MKNNKYSEIAYIENGLGYICEDKLHKCGCSGNPVANFHICNNEFADIQIYCEKCGMNTGVCETVEEAISKWQNAFGELNKLKQNIKSGLLVKSEDRCLGCSENFDKEEYY